MQSLKGRILNYLKSYWEYEPETYIHAGMIETQAQEAGYMASTATRELRRLKEEGVIESRPDKNKKSLEYKYTPKIEEIAKSL